MDEARCAFCGFPNQLSCPCCTEGRLGEAFQRRNALRRETDELRRRVGAVLAERARQRGGAPVVDVVGEARFREELCELRRLSQAVDRKQLAVAERRCVSPTEENGLTADRPETQPSTNP